MLDGQALQGGRPHGIDDLRFQVDRVLCYPRNPDPWPLLGTVAARQNAHEHVSNHGELVDVLMTVYMVWWCLEMRFEKVQLQLNGAFNGGGAEQPQSTERHQQGQRFPESFFDREWAGPVQMQTHIHRGMAVSQWRGPGGPMRRQTHGAGGCDALVSCQFEDASTDLGRYAVIIGTHDERGQRRFG